MKTDTKPWRIISGGTPGDTHIYMPDGQELLGVQAVCWGATIDDLTQELQLVLTCPEGVELELTGQDVVPSVLSGGYSFGDLCLKSNQARRNQLRQSLRTLLAKLDAEDIPTCE